MGKKYRKSLSVRKLKRRTQKARIAEETASGAAADIGTNTLHVFCVVCLDFEKKARFAVFLFHAAAVLKASPTKFRGRTKQRVSW